MTWSDGTCRSCRRPIRWCKTPLGKRMPIDPDPVSTGNLEIEDPRFDMPLVTYIKKDTPPNGQDRYTSHFATCPNAQHHRRK